VRFATVRCHDSEADVPSVHRLATTLLLAVSLLVVVGCGSVIEVAIDLHEGAETADLTVTVLGDEDVMLARFNHHLERSDPRCGERPRQAARVDTTGDVERVLDEADIPQEEFEGFVAHVLERDLEDTDSYAEVQRQREAGTLTFRTVERGAMRGQAMTFTNVAVDETPDTLDDLARMDRDSSLEEITVTHEGGEVTVVFATGREQDGADLSAVSPFQHDLIVTVPGGVTPHNAKEVDGARLLPEPALAGGFLPAPVGDPPPGWYGDPVGQARLRWWDGRRWTDHLG
jgi:hypothetical protein